MTNPKSQISNQKIALALHGGAGTITRALMDAEKEIRYKAALQAALDAGYAILEKGGTALDAVGKTMSKRRSSSSNSLVTRKKINSRNTTSIMLVIDNSND